MRETAQHALVAVVFILALFAIARFEYLRAGGPARWYGTVQKTAQDSN